MSLKGPPPGEPPLQTRTAIDSTGFSTETERILHLILANVDDLIAVVDLNGRRLYNSPSYKRILGDPKALRGTDSFGDIHPDDRAMVKRVFDETVRTGIGKRIEYRFLLKDGTVRHIESRGNAITNNTGTSQGIVIVARDITERKRSEKESALLHSAVGQISESVIVTTLDGTIEYVNPAFERISGYGGEEVLGRSTRFLKSGFHDNEYYQHLWATLLRGEVWSGRITNTRKDGALYQVETIISPVRDAAGNVVNYIAAQRDVTREQMIERHLYASQRMESLAQLAGGLAHNFNNIMNVLQGSFTLVKSNTKDPDIQRFIALGEGALKRGANAARKLATFAQKEESQLVPLAIGDVIRGLSDELHRTIEKGIAVTCTVEAGAPLCEGDAEKLLHGMLTICINARDAIIARPAASGTGAIAIAVGMIDGREVHRRFPEASAERYLRISIADDGIGMTEEVRQRIFEPFVSSTEMEKGRGFGLALAYATIKNHRGFIEVDSVVDHGSTFSIFLPAIGVGADQPAPPADGVIRGGSETVLVIEDEEALRLLLEAALVARGYTVMMAEDGSQGFQLFREHQNGIDIVLTDMGLPKQSGRDVFTGIRELDPKAKVIFMSGYLDPTLKSRLYAEGATTFIAKPFLLGDILRKIREVLDGETG
jgi:PAS domain S-box-containing protein